MAHRRAKFEYRPWGGFLWCCALMGLVSCDSGSEAPPTSPAVTSQEKGTTPPPSQSKRPSLFLLDQIAEAEIECGDLAPIVDGLRRREDYFREDFKGTRKRHWFLESWARSEGADPTAEHAERARIEGEDREVLLLQPAAGSLNRIERAHGSKRYKVTARVRPAALAAEPPTLRVVSLGFFLPRSTKAMDYLFRLEAEPLPDREGSTEHLVAGRADPADGWRRLELLIPSAFARKTLLITLDCDVPLYVDFLEIESLPKETGEQDGAAPPAEAADWMRNGFRIGAEKMECLALPSPARVTFEVTVPLRRPRLDFYTALIGAPGAINEIAVSVNDKQVRRQKLAIPNSRSRAFQSKVVSLKEFAGQKVRLSFESTGTPGQLPLVGAPWLLGSLASSSSTANTRRPNLLVLSLDTLRSDHLGCYGYSGGSSPTIDAFAAEGTLFERTQSPSALTLPSHATMFSGQNPLLHQANTPYTPIQPLRTPLLAVRMSEQGYACAAFTAGGQLDPDLGLDAGFRQYLAKEIGRAPLNPEAEFRPFGAALQWLKRYSDQPFFLFLHTYIIHAYIAEKQYLAPFEQDCSAEIVGLTREELFERCLARDAAAIAHAKHLYAATVLQADQTIVKPLLAAVEELGLDDNTLVVLVSDHGEEFFEHGGFQHGNGLWSELLTVPWILRGPGVKAGDRRSGLVRLEDFTPTVAQLLGLPPVPGVSGRPLLGAQESRDEETYAYAHLISGAANGRWDSLVDRPWKLVQYQPTGTDKVNHYLYNFDEDPRETNNLADTESEVLKRMTELLARRVEELEAAAQALPTSGESFELTPELAERLRELGYLQDEDGH